ncbi:MULTISPECIES: hypothetical protein [unclassified Curtobacterium]|uniref:hypothetical protein n=1 Tax=unclassified Curtobacterium TaxID=257496 RepID=UPI0015E8EA1D|nr:MULTISPECIES: hypothetical protein [unclassified Curtobacterium]WIB68557.1 hypothetical protein DEI93_05840 [Curtobacterium sp. MCBD17_035]WIE55740.1 hypothetical protein DEI88_005935 [Curtobacterium sp. MCBD17_003]
MSTHLLPVRHTAQRSPFTEIREARHQRALVASATVTGIVSVTVASLALVTLGLGA